MRPRLKIDTVGHKYLTVWHDPDDRDFTRIIRDGFKFHKVDDDEAKTISVVVLPIARKKMANTSLIYTHNTGT